jgi:UDP-2,4-diacetamido-2,4,6-trideoxy-beta-L-altropyranose hydrolase
VDASLEIGTGHVMRCLALANEAKQQGWESIFVLRDPDDEIVKLIASCDHRVKKLVSLADGEKIICNGTAHGDWLPVSQTQDANETVDVIHDLKPDWIIVDHYAIDKTWFLTVKKSIVKILVIDDLGDRDLICDLLLNQNLGASAEKYDGKLPIDCRLLLGPTFALLRSEFGEWRERSLEGRLDRNIENILITMGGGDTENHTLQALKEITKSKYAKKCAFTVIIGGSYPHTNTLYEFLDASQLKVSVFANVKNMAEIMSKTDLCIGAAGSTSWERCCMGQPTITFSIANNQREIAKQLSQKNVAIYSNISNLLVNFEQFFDGTGKELQSTLSINSRQICDGFGASRVVEELENKCED